MMPMASYWIVFTLVRSVWIFHCYQVKIWTVKKGSLRNTLVTKLHFSIFRTEGVNKKPIRVLKVSTKSNTVLFFFLDPFSTKMHSSIKKIQGFHLKQCDYGRSTLLRYEIKEIETFFRIFIICPPVHTFCKKSKGHKKERKMK